MKRLMALALASALALAACGTAEVDAGAGDATSSTASATTAATTEATDASATESSTAATEAATTTAAAEEGLGPDEMAITEAYAVAFNSESTYEETAPYLVAPEGLEETVQGYIDIGEQMGGVSVGIDKIELDGDSAAITYTLLFGGNPSYRDLAGTAVRTDAGWQISREMFCGLMSSARVGCPAG